MNFMSHVEHAIDAANRHDFDDALLHATIAVDRAAQLWANITRSNGEEYKDFLRSYYWLVERFADIAKNSLCTKFETVLPNGKNTQSDLVDLIYHIYRCNLCHGNEIPIRYKLTPQAGTTITANNNEILSLPVSIIWGLLAAAVFPKSSKMLATPTQYEIWYTPMKIIKLDQIALPEKKVLITYHTQIGEKSIFKITDTIGEEEMIREYCDGLAPSAVLAAQNFLVKDEVVTFLTIVL